MNAIDRNKMHLHKSIIEFITSNYRLPRFHWLSTWTNFFYEFPCPAYESLMTTRDVKVEFEEVILPTVFNYDLLFEQRKWLKSLEKSSLLCCTENGFQLKSPKTDLTETIEENFVKNRDYVDYGTPEAMKPNSAVVLAKTSDWERIRIECCGNIELQRWTSFLLQSPPERKLQILFSWKEIKKRLNSGQCIVGRVEDVVNDANFFEEMERRHKRRRVAVRRA